MFERIRGELLERNAEACLPCNLSDEWLGYLAASADKMLGNENLEAEAANEAAALAVVIRLIDAKVEPSATGMEIPIDDMYVYMQRFRIELALEEVHRKTDIKYEPATVSTIMTERNVETWKDKSREFSG
jgi:hypothetical protein